MVIKMGTNTNGFNYSSDYQGHNGVHIVIVVLLFFGLLAFGSSFKKGVPNNEGNSDEKTDVFMNDYNQDDDMNVLDDNNVTPDNSSIDNNEDNTDNGIVDHGYFELVQ